MFKVRITIVLIALFVVGIVLTFSGVSNLIKMSGNIKDFNYDSMQDIKKGDIVQGYVLNIDGCYAYTTTTNTKYGIETSSYTSDEYFLMPLVNETDFEKDLFITIIAQKKADRDLLYDISDATWEYYEGNVDVTFPEMGIVAKVDKLDAEYEGYLIECLLEAEYYSNASEARSHVIPYTLTIYNPSSAYTSLGIGLVIIVIYVVVGLILYSKYKASKTASVAQETAASNDFTIESKPSESGFGESYTQPQPVPMPELTQPTDADEFFAAKPKKVTAPPVEAVKEEPKEEPAAPEIAGEMSGLDTSGLFNDADYEVNYASDESEFIE
ncbi:MAG: hypothetical protein J6A05_05330 [Oscillospiraceae bacterium]|nr:hypothetical protein [Oscillospiraceae bacterium]